MSVARVMPVHTPLSGTALGRAATDTLPWRDDARPRLTKLLRTLYDADDALLLDRGTHALELAIRLALRYVGERTAIAIPAYTCFDVATAAVGAGAPVALYDVEPRTLAPDLASLDDAMSRGARVVLVSPLYGVPVDWDAIEACVARHGGIAIEDAAQGFGSIWKGRAVGSHGYLSVLSFGRGKGWTGGGGGALLARFGITAMLGPLKQFSPRPARAFAGFLAATAQWTFGRPSLYGIPASIPWLHLGETNYRQPADARGMSRASAGLLERSFAIAEREASLRQANARALIAQIAAVATARPARAIRCVRPPAGSVPGYLRLPILSYGGGAAILASENAARLGIGRGYPATLGSLAPVRALMHGRAPAHWPGAEDIVRDLITVPTHSLVTAAEREEQVRLLCAEGLRAG